MKNAIVFYRIGNVRVKCLQFLGMLCHGGAMTAGGKHGNVICTVTEGISIIAGKTQIFQHAGNRGIFAVAGRNTFVEAMTAVDDDEFVLKFFAETGKIRRNAGLNAEFGEGIIGVVWFRSNKAFRQNVGSGLFIPLLKKTVTGQ